MRSSTGAYLHCKSKTRSLRRRCSKTTRCSLLLPPNLPPSTNAWIFSGETLSAHLCLLILHVTQLRTQYARSCKE